MTTGTKTSGTRINTPTQSGSNAWTMVDYCVKSFNGTNQQTHSVQSGPPFKEGATLTFANARNGYEESLIPIVKRNFPMRKGGPRRKYSEEHPYTMTLTVSNDNVFGGRSHPVQPYTTRTGAQWGLLSSPRLDNGWRQANEYRLLQKLRNRVAGSSFDVGVFTGEMKESCGMIYNAARRIGGALYAVKRRDLGWAARILTQGTDREKLVNRKNPARNWLELQYGWLPLLSDAEEGAKFLAHALNVPLQRVVRVSERSNGYALPNATVEANWTTEGSYSKYSRRIKAIMKESEVQQLTGLVDPLTLAWELLPYSFVVDWFIPIGNYLQGRGLASRLTATYVISSKAEYFLGNFKPRAGSLTSTNGPVRTSSKGVSLTRTVTQSLEVPLPKAIELGSVLSWKRAANAVSLLLVKDYSWLK